MKYLIISPILCVASFLYYFKGNSTNHTGFDFLIFMWLNVFCAVIAAIKLKKSLSFTIPLVLNILSAIFFYTIDHLNIMVEYSRWIQRGMPERFEESKQKPKDNLPSELDDYAASTMRNLRDGKISQEEANKVFEQIRLEINRIRKNKQEETKISKEQSRSD